MALKTYNNNDNKQQITNTTYSSFSFSNSESRVMQSRISISYFNKLMKLSIALRNNAGSNEQYATYDNDNAVSVYISSTKAYVLAQLINKLITEQKTRNVCVELKNGLLKVSDGEEFDSTNYCITISYADGNGAVNEVIYETKGATGAYNYVDGEYSVQEYHDFELIAFHDALVEYYKASNYAIAASVMEANMYKRNSQYQLLSAIAEKVGAQNPNGSNRQFNNKTFLSGGGSSSSSMNSTIPKEYESTSFDSIADSM